MNLASLLDRPREIVQELPFHDELPNGSIVSPASITLPGSGRPRVILERKAVIIEGLRETQPVFARAWLSTFGKKKPARDREIAAAMLAKHTLAPHWARAPRDETYVLLDLRAAFLQIFSRVCWDIEYRKGGPLERYLGPGSGKVPLSTYPFDPHFKQIYASVISQSLPTYHITLVKDRALVGIEQPNYGMSNPQLVCFVSDVLHAIAWHAIHALEACRVNTDSYLVPERREAEAYAFFDSLGLVLGPTKHRGASMVRHLNAYRVGDKQSAPFDTAGSDLQPADNIQVDREVAEWLLKRFAGLTQKYSGLS